MIFTQNEAAKTFFFKAVWGRETLREAKWAGEKRSPLMQTQKTPGFSFLINRVSSSSPQPLLTSQEKGIELTPCHPPFFLSLPKKWVEERKMAGEKFNRDPQQNLIHRYFREIKYIFWGEGVSLCLGTVLRKYYLFTFYPTAMSAVSGFETQSPARLTLSIPLISWDLKQGEIFFRGVREKHFKGIFFFPFFLFPRVLERKVLPWGIFFLFLKKGFFPLKKGGNLQEAPFPYTFPLPSLLRLAINVLEGKFISTLPRFCIPAGWGETVHLLLLLPS